MLASFLLALQCRRRLERVELCVILSFGSDQETFLFMDLAIYLRSRPSCLEVSAGGGCCLLSIITLLSFHYLAVMLKLFCWIVYPEDRTKQM